MAKEAKQKMTLGINSALGEYKAACAEVRRCMSDVDRMRFDLAREMDDRLRPVLQTLETAMAMKAEAARSLHSLEGGTLAMSELHR